MWKKVTVTKHLTVSTATCGDSEMKHLNITKEHERNLKCNCKGLQKVQQIAMQSKGGKHSYNLINVCYMLFCKEKEIVCTYYLHG